MGYTIIQNSSFYDIAALFSAYSYFYVQENAMRILYKDKDIMVVHKEAGLAVQSRSATQKDLESILLTLQKQENPSSKAELHIINRLDQPVEGLVLCALNRNAAADLTRQQKSGIIEKNYRATVQGQIPKKEDTLTDYLIRDGRSNMSRIVPEKTPGAKRAVLSYKKLSDHELFIVLKTGRHHQIRVQLAGAGMPILGDRKYGLPDAAYRGRLMLTACRIAFKHPGTGKRMEFTIEDDS